MRPVKMFETVHVNFSVEGVNHESFVQISTAVLSHNKINEIIKKSITQENKANKLIVVNELPKTEVALKIENLVVHRLSLGQPLSYIKRLSKLFSDHHFLYFPIVGWLIALVWALFSSDEEIFSSDRLLFSQKTPESAFSLMDLIEKHAGKFKENEKFVKLAAHAREAKKWSFDLLNNKKTLADLKKEKIDLLQEGESFSLVLGYWRATDFCPLIVSVTKEGSSFILDSFCVDEKQGKRAKAHHSWRFDDAQKLADSLEKAVLFAKKPSDEHFQAQIVPKSMIGKVALQGMPVLEILDKETPLDKDPSVSLFRSFIDLGGAVQEIKQEKLVKTDRWERVAKHWQRSIIKIEDKEEALFQANLKLSLMKGLISEIKNSRTSSHDKWMKLSSLQQEAVALKTKIQKNLDDIPLRLAVEKNITDFDEAVQSAFSSILQELYKPLKIEKMPVIQLGAAAKSAVLTGETDLVTLRGLRKELSELKIGESLKIGQKFLEIFPKYIQSVQNLTKNPVLLSDSVTALFALLPAANDQFWIQEVLPEQIPELAEHLASLVQLQFEAQIQLKKGNAPPSCVMQELNKARHIISYLHFCRTRHVQRAVLFKALLECPPDVKDKSGDVVKSELKDALESTRTLNERFLIMRNDLKTTTVSSYSYEQPYSQYYEGSVYAARLQAKAEQEGKPFYRSSSHYFLGDAIQDFSDGDKEKNKSAEVAAHHAYFCKKINISLQDCLELSAPSYAYAMDDKTLLGMQLSGGDQKKSPFSCGVNNDFASYLGKDAQGGGGGEGKLQYTGDNIREYVRYELEIARFKEIAKKYDGSNLSFEEAIPKTYQAILRSEACLRMLTGEGEWSVAMPQSEALLQSARKQMEGAGYRDLKDEDVQIVAKRQQAIELLGQDPFSFKWDVDKTGQAVVHLGNATWKSTIYERKPGQYRLCKKNSKKNIIPRQQAKMWRAGLKGRLPADLLCCFFGFRNERQRNDFSYTPQKIAEMEFDEPTLKGIPTSTCIALRNLLNPRGASVAKDVLDCFIKDHEKYLELEEVQRRLEYVIYYYEIAPSAEVCQEIAARAILEKKYKTAGFLFSYGHTNLEEVKAFYRERLESDSLTYLEKKYFGCLALKVLQENAIATVDDWKMALQAYRFMMACPDEIGNPDLQETMAMRMREKFIPQLQDLREDERNTILSSLTNSKEKENWKLDGVTWKVVDKAIFFDAYTGVVTEDGSQGILPDCIYLHPDYLQVFGTKQQKAITQIEDGQTWYTFDSYTLKWNGKDLIIEQKIEERTYVWKRLEIGQDEIDSRLVSIERAGVWIDCKKPLEGRILLGGTELKATFIEEKTGLFRRKTGKTLLDSITNQEGDRLVLTNAALGLLKFSNLSSTFVFVDSSNKLKEALFADIKQSIKRTKQGFLLIDQDQQLELNVVDSKKDQSYALQVATARLPEYGVLCSPPGSDELQLQLFFPKKRKTNRPLTLHLEKPTLLEGPPRVTGSCMSFLFMSEQAASEGQFEKAAELLQQARNAAFSYQEKQDFDWFVEALENFEASSLPAKSWKLKCMMAVMEIQIREKELQRPLIDPQNYFRFLKQSHETLVLWNEIKTALDKDKSPKAERKEKRLKGILTITTEETRFLNHIFDLSLAHFTSLEKEKEFKEDRFDHKQGFSLGFVNPMGLFDDQPWLYIDIAQKPDEKKSIFSLPIYPSLQDLIGGFTSFARQILVEKDLQLRSKMFVHIKSLQLETIHPNNQMKAHILHQLLLSLENCTEEEKRASIAALDGLKPPVLGKKQVEAFLKEGVNPFKDQMVVLWDAFPKQKEPVVEPQKEPPVLVEEKSPVDTLIKRIDSKESPLSDAEKEKWKKVLGNRDHYRGVDLIPFLNLALSYKEDLFSAHLLEKIEKDITDLKPKSIDEVSCIEIKLAESVNWSEFLEEKTVSFDKDLKRVLSPELQDELMNLELKRIEDTQVPDKIMYTVKDQKKFSEKCVQLKNALSKQVYAKVDALLERYKENLEYSDAERFERLVDDFIVRNSSEDQEIAEILTALIAIRQLDKKVLPEVLVSAFNMKRLEGLTSFQQRAVLVGEYRSGNVSRSFQPPLIKEIISGENKVILSPPGSGKTTTILPAAAQIIAKEQGKCPVILLTDELFHVGKEGFDVTTKALFRQASCVFTFDRNNPKDPIFLAQLALKIRTAQANRGYIITTIACLAALENEIIFMVHEKNNPGLSEGEKQALAESIKWLENIWGLFHGEDVRFIADEIDELYRPNIDYNYALGTPCAIDLGIQAACFTIMKQLFSMEDGDAGILSKAIQSGNQSKLSEEQRNKSILHLAECIAKSRPEWEGCANCLVDIKEKIPERLQNNEEFAHFRHFLAITLKNMPLCPGSEYGPEKDGFIQIVPKRKTIETVGTKYSDPYELTLIHYLYYAVQLPSEDYLRMFWMKNESKFLQGKIPEPWNEWKEYWEKDVMRVSSIEKRHQLLNDFLRKKESVNQRLAIIQEDIIAEHIKIYPQQIRSNAHEILAKAKVCGASGTVNPDALGVNFDKHESLTDRRVMKEILGLIDLDTPLDVIDPGEDFFVKQAKSDVCAIIDQAGLQREKNSLQIAEILRNASDKKRQILFIHPKYRQKWMWNPNEQKPRPFMGKADKDSLCYYGEADCRGIDWVLPKGEFTMIVGPSCSDEDFVQSYLRARRAGQDQTVRLFVEKGFMTEGATALDLMRRVIRQGSHDRAPLNLKARLRNIPAKAVHAKRRNLFTSNPESDFPGVCDFVKTRKIQWEQDLDTHSETLVKDFLSEFEQDQKTLYEHSQDLVGAGDLAGLPTFVIKTNLSGGDRETVQEQQLVQAQVAEQQQQQSQEMLKFFLKTKKDYPSTEHDARIGNFPECSIDDIGEWAQFRAVRYHANSRSEYEKLRKENRNIRWYRSASRKSTPFENSDVFHASGYEMLSERCLTFQSSQQQLNCWMHAEGLQGKSSFLWFVRKIKGEYTFRLIDPWHYAKLLEKKPEPDWRINTDEKLADFTQDFVVHLSDGASSLKLHGGPQTLPSQDDEDGSVFWDVLIEAKILSGCWSFPVEEQAVLRKYLQSQRTRLDKVAQTSVLCRLGEANERASDYKKIPGWIDSDLCKAIEEVKKEAQ